MPSSERESSVEMSLIIPAYNEEWRLPRFLESVQPYMIDVYGDSHEVIVVDDGSRDRSADVVEEASQGWPQLRLARHVVNMGKGSAVRTGVLASHGRLLLFSDADGAAPISEEWKLRTAIAEGADVAVGSRLLYEGGEHTRPWHRAAVGLAFARLARFTAGLPVRDTQCGFKMFRGTVGRQLFRMCSRNDYLFDIFVLLAAKHLGYSIAEVGVQWHDVPGSRINLLRDPLKMATGLITMRRQVIRQLSRQQLGRDAGTAAQAAERLPSHGSDGELQAD